MYTRVNLPDRETWLEERKKGIGSSEAGTIAGMSCFDTPLQLWRRKVGIDPPTQETNIMTMGHYLEPMVAELYAQATGAIIDKGSEGDWLAVDTEKPYLRVSPDRLWWPKGTPTSEQTEAKALILECKSTDKYVTPATLPDYWYCQVQYQMHVMGHKKCVIAWLNRSRGDFGWTEVQYAPGFAQWLIAKMCVFWEKNVCGRIPPDEILNGRDAALRWNIADEDASMLVTKDIAEAVERYNRIAPEKALAEKELENLTTKIKAAMGPAEMLVTEDGEILATWKNTKGKDGTAGARRFSVRPAKAKDAAKAA